MLKIRPDRRLAHSRLTKERNKEEKIKHLIAGYVVYYTLTPPWFHPHPPPLVPPSSPLGSNMFSVVTTDNTPVHHRLKYCAKEVQSKFSFFMP